MEYSTRQLEDKFKITRSRLHQLRCGYKRAFKRDKKVYANYVAPILIENKDWYFRNGKVKFISSSIKKLKKIIKSKN